MGCPAFKEAAEDLLEMDADVLKGLAELVGHGLVDVGDDGPQLLSILPNRGTVS